MRKIVLLVSVLLLAINTVCGKEQVIQDKPFSKDKNATKEKRVEDLLIRMTLKEKLLQMQNMAAGKIDEKKDRFNGRSFGCTHEMNMSAFDCSVMYQDLQGYMLTDHSLQIPSILLF